MCKICSKCKVEKSKDSFTKHRNRKDGLYAYCKQCRAKQYVENRVDICNQQKAYRKSNSNTVKLKQTNHYNLNKNKYLVRNARRRALKISATPRVLIKEDLEFIEDLYIIAKMFKLYTGQDYYVDHIIPLQGKDVCGLHVPWNLQVILAKENLSKSNKFICT